VGSLTVLPLPRFGPAQDADDEGLTEAGAAQPAAGPRVPLVAAAATFAAGLAHPPLQQGLPPPCLLLGLALSMILAVMGPTVVPLLFTMSTQVCALHLASAFLI
jgi:hypothetical protein